MRFTYALLVCSAVYGLASAQALPEQPADIGYPTPAAALSALRAKPGVVVTERPGWTVAEDKSEKAIWTIAEPGNPAYPAAIKRYLSNEGDGVHLEMKVLCGASKEACDNMVRQFQQLNSNVVNAVQQQRSN
ncbi:hypothetical protein GCM10007862_34000 [Dyella lipolytica]|uniref:Molecular chaperone DnaJ n=1 Tax=Dyella lipolytica TaxID=1867835 RepID=A0ABW8IWY2_9GAMM|nr:hypothetical protein [Dyella lipolytica]GLQ48349.1 hypothetical protein GCM10007862_34000 [Dyella lipolytica]